MTFPAELIEPLASYGVLGLWVMVGVAREYTQTAKLIKSLDTMNNTLKVHDEVMRAKLCK